ncbi:MAG TPA: 30S ribosomal protein S16 [Candidatus Polarisedimenticolaceae bacterium]|nr:30S ribosomal protein S16 [Candidatus Polarisedimenticolaceae bacterium]
MIRLRRMGSRQRACYRVVVSDSRSTPTGRFLEILGTYDPGRQPAQVRLNVPRVEEWIKKGAHPSETVKRLLLKTRPAEA